MSRPLLLDLFCGAGGAAAGYHRAGFDIIGVDLHPQPNYPYPFIQADVTTIDVAGFAAIHASPPCQAHSVATGAHRSNHLDLIPATRGLLEASGLPYVIENVVGAPLHNPAMYCGRMFDELRVYRHRLFETNWGLEAPAHIPHDRLCFTRDKRKPHYGQLDEMTAFVQVTGGGNCSKAAAADAMGIDWMTKNEMNQAIPPTYTEHIGAQLLAAL